METCEVEGWVLVEQDGEYEVSKDADDLQPQAGQASRLVRVRLTVPVPRPVELAAVVADEPMGGELKVAG